MFCKKCQKENETLKNKVKELENIIKTSHNIESTDNIMVLNQNDYNLQTALQLYSTPRIKIINGETEIEAIVLAFNHEYIIVEVIR